MQLLGEYFTDIALEAIRNTPACENCEHIHTDEYGYAYCSVDEDIFSPRCPLSEKMNELYDKADAIEDELNEFIKNHKNY